MGTWLALAALAIDASRRRWFVPVIALAFAVAAMPANGAFLSHLAGNNYVVELLWPEHVGVQSLWPWTAATGTILILATLSIVWPLAMLALLLWPARRK